MVWHEGMATMIHRTTFALDEKTANRIRELAKSWQVSQAEVIRRAVANADVPPPKLAPIDMLRQLHADGAGLSAEDAHAYLEAIREDRRKWRGR